MGRTMIVKMPDGSEVERPVASMERDEQTGMMIHRPELREGEEAVYTLGSSRPMIIMTGGE